MEVIYKYPIRNGTESFELPEFSILRYMDYQASEEAIYLWIEINTDNKIQTHTFQIVGTGQILPEYKKYIGSCQVLPSSTPLVWHVYEI